MATAPSANRKLRKQETVPLNLIPIMNLFIVIIPVLLMMWVTVEVAMLSINMGAAATNGQGGEGGGQSGDSIRELQVAIVDSGFEIKEIAGKKGEKDILEVIPAINQAEIDTAAKAKQPTPPANYDFKKLNTALAELHNKYPAQNVITVLPSPQVQYDALLKTIDICKLNKLTFVKYSFMLRNYYQQ